MAIEIANKNYSSPGSGESDPYVNKKKNPTNTCYWIMKDLLSVV